MADPKIETFEQFWDFYVGEHKKKSTRLFHFVEVDRVVRQELERVQGESGESADHERASTQSEAFN
ncbi:MAG: hypothetical protein K0S65_6608 [Labilithrix sp.]|nr:hypothetical protein [Labilithrix sp.]